MKHIFFAFGLFFSLTAFPQIVLEHTYNGEVKRGKFEKSGEKYYRLDDVNQRVTLYNKDHSLWQEIPFPTDTNGTVIRIFEVSETKIIPDNLIEVVYLFDGGVDGLFLRVMNETGKIFLNQSNVSTFQLSSFPGYPTKLITTNGLMSTDIIAVPSLLTEHSFQGNNVQRILLDNGEVKYFYADAQQAHVYNDDYSVYKHITLPAWFQGGSMTIEHASQTKIKPDGLLEILVRKSTGGAAVLINENGDELKRASSGFLTVSTFAGHPDKVILHDTVFTLPGLTTEHIYNKFYPFRVLTESGPKYLMGWNDSVRGYDAAHSLFFNMKVPHSFNYLLSNLYNFSEKIFNSDNKMELLYRTVNLSNDSAGAEGKICNQDQAVIFHEDDVNYFVLSQLGSGIQNKLLSYISNWGEPVFQTKVYGLPSYDFTAIDEVITSDPDIRICPNPASIRMTICGASEQPYLVTFFDIKGTEIKKQALEPHEEVDLTALPQGIYLVTIKDKSGHTTTRKLVVN